MTAECAIGAEPWPASEENRARLIPHIAAYPMVPPMNAPLAGASPMPTPYLTISIRSSGICQIFNTKTIKPANK